jgi:CBS domain-containing protein
MAQDNTVARSLHDLGLAAWFGGSLMGAVGLNGAAAVVDRPEQRLRVANAGWARWTPVNLAGIAAHVAGGAVLLVANKGRVAGQRGVARATIAKTALTGLALAATGSARVLGAKLERVGDAPVEGGTTPTAGSPEKGPLPVVEGGRVVAMVTDRDLVARVVAASRDPNTVRCEEVATKDLVMIRPEQDLGEARRLLAQHQLDRLLVVEEGDRLVGILSEADLRQDEGPLARRGRGRWRGRPPTTTEAGELFA